MTELVLSLDASYELKRAAPNERTHSPDDNLLPLFKLSAMGLSDTGKIDGANVIGRRAGSSPAR